MDDKAKYDSIETAHQLQEAESEAVAWGRKPEPCPTWSNTFKTWGF